MRLRHCFFPPRAKISHLPTDSRGPTYLRAPPPTPWPSHTPKAYHTPRASCPPWPLGQSSPRSHCDFSATAQGYSLAYNSLLGQPIPAAESATGLRLFLLIFGGQLTAFPGPDHKRSKCAFCAKELCPAPSSRLLQCSPFGKAPSAIPCIPSSASLLWRFPLSTTSSARHHSLGAVPGP